MTSRNNTDKSNLIEYIQSHGKLIERYSKQTEKNYLCPQCNDGKENNLHVNIIDQVCHCKKCGLKSVYEFAKLLGYEPKQKSENKPNYLQWEYTDSKGNFLYAKRRFDLKDGSKSYIPIIKIDNQILEVVSKLNYGKTINPRFEELSDIFASIPRVVYNLPRVKKSNIVFFVEGEKCAKRLQEEINKASSDKDKIKSYLKKYAATTVYDSLDINSKHYITQLSGKIIIILPDNDKTGFEKASAVETALKKYCRVVIVKPEIFGLKDKEDIYDFFENSENTWDKFESLVNEYIPLFGNNDIDRTKKFVQKYGAEIRHSNISGYYFWNGKVWEQNDKHVLELAKSYSLGLHDKFLKKYKDNPENNREYKHLAIRVASEKAIKTILNLAQSEPEIAIQESSFDSDKNILNLNNVSYDLLNHKYRRHSQDDNLTIVLPYDFDSKSKCPVWEKFLNRIFDNDKELIGYIQELIGYTLTGETKLQSWFFLYGSGRNGKSVFSEIINRLLGSYGTKIRTESIMAKDNNSGGDKANPEIAKLKGKRFVLASEISDSHKLNESLVKDLTGGDVISARFLNLNSFEFTPQCKLWVYGNHKPYVKGTDEGIWRRIKLIPFKVTIPENEVDTNLIDKLTNEISGILNWSLEGLKRLQKLEYRIIEPTIIKEETKAYRNEMDIIGQFLLDNGYEYGAYKILCKELHDEYKEYCNENGYHALSTRRISDYLKTNQVDTKAGTGNKKSYYGVGKRD